MQPLCKVFCMLALYLDPRCYQYQQKSAHSPQFHSPHHLALGYTTLQNFMCFLAKQNPIEIFC